MPARNNRVDNLKLIMAVFVVLIHTTSWISKTDPNFIRYYSYRNAMSIAVPFFFAVSGYYTSKMTTEKKSKKLFDTIKLFFASSMFYVFVEIIISFFNNQGLSLGNRMIIALEPLAIINPKTILRGEFGSYQLYYLTSLILVYIVSYIILEKHTNEIMFVISLVTYLIFLSLVQETSPFYIMNGFVRAFLGFSIGALVKSQPKKNITAGNFHLIKSLMELLTYSVIRYLGYVWAAEILLYFSLYNLVCYATANNNEKLWINNSHKLSTYIYVLHPFFMRIFKYIYIEHFGFLANNLTYTLLITVFSVVMSYFSLSLYEYIHKFKMNQ